MRWDWPVVQGSWPERRRRRFLRVHGNLTALSDLVWEGRLSLLAPVGLSSPFRRSSDALGWVLPDYGSRLWESLDFLLQSDVFFVSF